MLQRQTQTAAFWRDQFEVSSHDLDFLYNLILDAQTPIPLPEMATNLIDEYLRRENVKIETELSKGQMYLPREQYEVGQKLVFPALEFAVGEIVEVRSGQNPEYGDFNVIRVSIGDPEVEREFAAGLNAPHRLNEINGQNLLNDDTLLSAQEIFSLYQDEILESLLYALEDGERSSDFVDVDEDWLLSDMLAEVHVGHLNIAEAAIDMQGEPLSVDQMLAVVEDAVALDKNVSPAMRLTSLNHALDSDARFDTVWQNDERYWFLARMEPPEVIAVPPLLRVQPVDYNRSLLSVELLQVEWELDDEWGESSLSSSVPSVVPNTSLMLTYPHRRYGTLPISGRTSSFFPQRSSGKSIVTLVDGRWGTRYSGWVYHSGRYVAGLGKWMDDHALPVGAFVTLERSDTPGEVVIDFRTRRAKREWARIASANLEEQRLIFEMNKIQVACEYDEYLIAAESDREPIDRLRTDLDSMGVSLAQIVEQVVPELTKLNPQGTVHAKTVYSAVNILRRCPPGPVFYALISNRKFKDVGAGLFALA